VNNQLCYDCAFKHVSAAWVAWCEIYDGYKRPDHFMKVIGHLAHAEEHLVDRHVEIAEKLREERKLFWDAIVMDGFYRPCFEEINDSIWDLVQQDLGNDEVEESTEVAPKAITATADVLMDFTTEALKQDPSDDGEEVRLSVTLDESSNDELKHVRGRPAAGKRALR